MIGRTLAHYRVTAQLGAGGMGEVYRATDENLGREVAIKVLPPEVVKDPERLARFQREAHLLAALNHPNIAAIYGLEEAEGQPFLALELVEGEDLRERLARGPIPVRDALEIAEQVAEALEEAHAKGIVHRDLKPANVKLTPDGRVKVLDFGLAKAWSGDGSAGDSVSSALSQSPTLAHTGTVAGVILGTAAYMSPEQARGKPVDRRADVWSFGVLLWEMLTGHALFAGDTVTDVIAAVVTKEPDLDALPRETPAAVRRLVARCLRKDARARLPDAGAARLELQDVLAGTTSDAEAPSADIEAALAAERRGRGRERRGWFATTLLAAGLAGAIGYVHLSGVPDARPAAHFTVDAPEGTSFVREFGWPEASPDGRQVAFQAQPNDPGPPMLWIRPLESLLARPLAGTEGVVGGPYWSPDGRHLAFVAGSELRRLSLIDGTVQRIAALPTLGLSSADWGEDGTILIALGGGAGRIYAVPATGGEARPLTTHDAAREERAHHWPQFLPGGDRFLFSIVGSDATTGTYVASLDAPDERQRIATGDVRRAHAGGRLLFVREGSLLAQPFDAGSGTASGEATTIASSVGAWANNPEYGWFAASRGGTLAYLSGTGLGTKVQLAWRDRQGTDLGALGAPGEYGQLALSPDGRNVALEIRADDQLYDLWVMDVARGVSSRLTDRPGNDRDAVWAPDSRSIAFIAGTGDGAGVFRKGLRASDPETVLVDSEEDDIPESWSADGRTLLVVRRSSDGSGQTAWAVSLDGDGDAEPLVTNAFADEPQLSPDGRWLAYVSQESGADEVYVEPFRREGQRVRVSVNGGGQPKWRGDGRELFYVTPQGKLMAVEVRPDDESVEVSLPAELFDLQVIQGMGYDDYAVADGGERFLVKVPVGEAAKPQVHVITNWTSLLE